MHTCGWLRERTSWYSRLSKCSLSACVLKAARGDAKVSPTICQSDRNRHKLTQVGRTNCRKIFTSPLVGWCCCLRSWSDFGRLCGSGGGRPVLRFLWSRHRASVRPRRGCQPMPATNIRWKLEIWFYVIFFSISYLWNFNFLKKIVCVIFRLWFYSSQWKNPYLKIHSTADHQKTNSSNLIGTGL